MTEPDYLVQAVSLYLDRGRTFRLFARQLGITEENLSKANLDFADFGSRTTRQLGCVSKRARRVGQRCPGSAHPAHGRTAPWRARVGAMALPVVFLVLPTKVVSRVLSRRGRHVVCVDASEMGGARSRPEDGGRDRVPRKEQEILWITLC